MSGTLGSQGWITLDDVTGDLERLIGALVVPHVDGSNPLMHDDELRAECWAKLAKILSNGHLSKCPSRAKAFGFIKAAMQNHLRSLVQKYAFTEKRTGIKPPPKRRELSEGEFNSQRTKASCISLNDEENPIDVGKPDSAFSMMEFLEELDEILTPEERNLFQQLIRLQGDARSGNSDMLDQRLNPLITRIRLKARAVLHHIENLDKASVPLPTGMKSAARITPKRSRHSLKPMKYCHCFGMSPFHEGMNFWQRQWLSDRLHGKHQAAAPPATYYPPQPSAVTESQKPKKDPAAAKVLRLKPDPSKALKMLEEASYKENPDLVRALLTLIPPDRLNNTPRRSSCALEKFVAHGYIDLSWSKPRDEEHLKCVELLLDAGARWNPPTEELRGVRRDILRHDARYIVQLLRLLLYTPNAADIAQFLELCRSKALEDKIATADQPLAGELKVLRKSKLSANVPDAPVKTEADPSAANLPDSPPESEPPQPSTPRS